jgi:hypothetical protein
MIETTGPRVLGYRQIVGEAVGRFVPCPDVERMPPGPGVPSGAIIVSFPSHWRNIAGGLPVRLFQDYYDRMIAEQIERAKRVISSDIEHVFKGSVGVLKFPTAGLRGRRT